MMSEPDCALVEAILADMQARDEREKKQKKDKKNPKESDGDT